MRIAGSKSMLCITVDELSTFLKSSSNLKNLKVIISFTSEDDFRKVESSSIGSSDTKHVFTACNSHSSLILKLIIISLRSPPHKDK